MQFAKLIAILAVVSFSWSALAQEDTSTTESTTKVEAPEVKDDVSAPTRNKNIEKIEVTGSNIKRIDVEGPSPVLVLDREYLDNTGYNSVGDVLRDTTVASLGGLRESALSGGANTGASTTSLRGFQSGDILIMLDGQRLPTIGGGTSVDLNLIPMSAIERIEILKDGASAIYGSDALGGVINFITKKDYDGAEVMLRHSIPEENGGAKTDIVATYGKSGSNYNFLSVVQYKKNLAIGLRERDFSSPKGVQDFSSFGSPGSWSDDGGATFNPGGGADPCPADQQFGGFCAYDFSPYMQIMPETEQGSALIRGTYDINGSLSAFGRVIAVQRNVTGQLAPPPDRFFDNSNGGGDDTRISANTFNNIWGVGGATGPVNVRYRLVEEAGPRQNEVTTGTYSVNTGVKGALGDSWDWEASVNYGYSATRNEGVNGFAQRSRLKELADAGGFNPFAASGAKNDISSALYNPVQDIKSSIGGVILKASGEVLDMPAGPMGLAVGVSGNWQTFDQSADEITANKDQWGGAGANTGSGLRDFQSTWLEFSIPVLRSLEFQAAGRFDNFSDFGSTVNPKLGFRYKPFNALMLRGSWGTGFKAPSLFNLYSDAFVTFPQALDPETNVSQQWQTIGGGNANLQEETSESINVGAVFQILERMSFSVDYYEVQQDSIVSSLATQEGLRDIFRAEQLFGNSYLNGFGINVDRVTPNGPINFISAPAVNLSRREIKGMDFRYSYTPKLFSNWNLNFIMDHSILIQLLEEPFPGLGVEDRAGFHGRPYWKNYVTLGFVNPTHGINWIIKSIGEQNATFTAQDPGSAGKTRDHTEVDFRYTYNTDFGAQFAVGAMNIFGIDRPESVDNGTTGAGYLNAEIYDPVGRAYYMSYTQSF